MKHEAGLIGILLLVLLAFYLLRKRMGLTSVTMTTTTTNGQLGIVQQECVADDGSSWTQPVTAGPCPKLATAPYGPWPN